MCAGARELADLELSLPQAGRRIFVWVDWLMSDLGNFVNADLANSPGASIDFFGLADITPEPKTRMKDEG